MAAIQVLLVVWLAACANAFGLEDPTILNDGMLVGRSDLTCSSHTLTEGSYTISSPNHPSNYNNNFDCAYRLTPGAGVSAFAVQCPTFDVEEESTCNYDWLQVNGEKFCGKSGPSLTWFEVLDISFHTDSSIVRPGFQCTITALTGGQDQELACGAHTVTPGLYSIKSPNFPAKYGNNIDCSYSITPGSGVSTMTLACCAFSIEKSSSCGWDWLKVNGDKYCGRQGPAVSNRDALTIAFHSDGSVVESGFYCEIRTTS